MASTSRSANPAKQPSANANLSARREAVWVFEANPGVSDGRGAEEIAQKCHGAKSTRTSGPAGSSYALVTRDANGKLLPLDQIREAVEAFKSVAESYQKYDFQIVASCYRKSEEEHQQFAELFRNAPSNCLLPGRWLTQFGRLNTTRIIILDANVKAVDTAARKNALDQYFIANEGLWTTAAVEIVSFGLAHTLVHNDKYARGRGYGHYIVKLNPKRYGRFEDLARQLLSMTYATKLVCFSDPMGTSTGLHMVAMQYAVAAGLEIDEVFMSSDE